MTNDIRNTKNKFKTYALAGAAVVALAGIGVTQLAAKSGDTAVAEEAAQPVGPTVTIAHPTVKEIIEWDEYSGRFEAIDNVEIRARVSGYLTEIAFTPGEIVEAGDLLFRVDPRPYEAALAAAKADLAGADASLRNARTEYRRGKTLLEKEAISKEAVDNRLRAMRVAEAEWAAAKANVEQADLNLEFTEVRAPITGRISDDFVSEGNLIIGGAAGGTVLTSLVSMDPIYFEFTASEADYLKYLRLDRKGTRVSGRDEQHPVRVKLMDEDTFAHEGKLSFVDNQIDRSTGTMRGRATLANPDGVLAPGMFGRLELLGSGAYDAVMIPDTAVQTDQAEKFVWVTTSDGTAARQRIELGPIVDGLRVVRAGLDSDANVIISGTQFVQANAPVNAQVADDARLAQLNLR
ncbi:MAG: efflux RND transporter periplasmic adaptor subunit [Pseudomonadota bacterium]